jgi:class 3 adenylate cyclase
LGEENLMGPEVNFAFRIEKVAANLGRSFLVSEPAATGLRPHMPLQEEGSHPVASFDGVYPFFGPLETPGT